jgi:O-acetyl-ADP-ribose deacetylase (regulator of RNase III)
MKELKTDLFETIYEDGVDAICITTNGQYTMQGLAAMGGGCAGVCARRWPETAQRLGRMLKTFGSNIPFVIGALDDDGEYLEPTRDMIKNKEFKCLIFSFPTINNLIHGSNLQLIKQSATLLKDYVEQFGLKNVMVPRPGVGIGGLDWAEVKPAIENILDDRFTVVSFEHEAP